MIFFSYIIRLCACISLICNVYGHTNFDSVNALEDHLRSFKHASHVNQKKLTQQELNTIFNTIAITDTRLHNAFDILKGFVSQEIIIESASYLSFFLEIFIDSIIKMRNFILAKDYENFKLIIYTLTYTISQVLYNVKKINPAAFEHYQKYMNHIINKNIIITSQKKNNAENDTNLLLADIALQQCQNIDEEALRYEVWDIIEILVMNSYINKNEQKKAYDVLKNYLDILLLTAHKPVVPSFSFYVTMFTLKLSITQTLSEHMIAFINEKISAEYEKKQKEHSFKDRIPHGTPEAEAINNFSYIAYFYPSKSHTVCVFNKIGWIADLTNRLIDVEYIYDKDKNAFKDNIILVVPYFNAYIHKLEHNYLLSDTITLSLLKRSLFSNSTQHIIPLFVTTPKNKSENGIGVLAAYIGRDLQRTAIMCGAPDLFYQPLNQVYLSYNRVFYEPYIRIPKQSSPYLTKNSQSFQQFLARQNIFDGSSNEFWELVQKESLFKNGNVSIQPVQGYGIQKINNKKVLALSYNIIQQMVQGYEKNSNDSYGFSTLIPLRQIIPKGAKLPQDSFVLTLDKKPFVLKKVEANLE